MVKIRGQRVELDEVESVLCSHASVVEAAAFTIPDDSSNLLILAAVTIKPQVIADEKELLEFVKNKLPVYAIPTKIEIKTTLPHNSSGKIDRKQLSKQYKFSDVT